MRGNGCSDNTGGDDGNTLNVGDYQGGKTDKYVRVDLSN